MSFMALISSHVIIAILTMSVGALWTVNSENPVSPDTYRYLGPPDARPWVKTTVVAHVLGLIRALSKAGVSGLEGGCWPSSEAP
jgi:hypothetical protein